MCAIRQMDDENQSREASRIDARITFVTREFELGTVLHFFTFRSIGFFILFLLFFFFRNTQRRAYIYIYIYPERVRNERSYVPIYRSIISWLALFWENRGDRPLSLHAIYDWFKVLVLFFPLSLCAAPATEKNTET